ncbi:MAG: hypothetical protein ABRQ39_28615 [Candidatus Eremiobacterota bacterium]
MIKTDVNFSGIFPGHPPGPPVQKGNRIKNRASKNGSSELSP